jgi:hypothetical protein
VLDIRLEDKDVDCWECDDHNLEENKDYTVYGTHPQCENTKNQKQYQMWMKSNTRNPRLVKKTEREKEREWEDSLFLRQCLCWPNNSKPQKGIRLEKKIEGKSKERTQSFSHTHHSLSIILSHKERCIMLWIKNFNETYHRSRHHTKCSTNWDLVQISTNLFCGDGCSNDRSLLQLHQTPNSSHMRYTKRAFIRLSNLVVWLPTSSGDNSKTCTFDHE